ncbi:MAG TPA: hypothetical protein VKT70_04505 [Stellaceae bacterium]|nr:hypothetical protein [Stellaceae bacterium]
MSGSKSTGASISTAAGRSARKPCLKWSAQAGEDEDVFRHIARDIDLEVTKRVHESGADEVGFFFGQRVLERFDHAFGVKRAEHGGDTGAHLLLAVGEVGDEPRFNALDPQQKCARGPIETLLCADRVLENHREVPRRELREELEPLQRDLWSAEIGERLFLEAEGLIDQGEILAEERPDEIGGEIAIDVPETVRKQGTGEGLGVDRRWQERGEAP